MFHFMQFLTAGGGISPTTFAINAADLNGTTQYFDGGTSAAYLFAGSYTATIWYKRPVTPTGSSILGRINSGANAGMTMDDDGTTLSFTHNNRGTTEGGYLQAFVSTPISDDTWYSLAAVFEDGVSLRLYVDGVLQDTDVANNTPLVSNAQDFRVGARDTSPENFAKMQVCMLTLHDAALSAGELVAHYNLGIAQCFTDTSTAFQANCFQFTRLCNFEGNAGNELIDQSGNANTLTNIGSTPFTGTGLIGECEALSTTTINSANLNGTTQYFDAGNPAALQLTGNFTASIWVKFDAITGSSQVFFAKSDASNQRSWMLYYTGGVQEFRGAISTNGTTFDIAPEGPTPVADEWYHMAMSYDGANVSLYIDSVLQDSPAYVGVINNSTADVLVGRRGDPTSELYFDGSVVFPQVWGRGLSQSEVTELYNTGIPLCSDDLSVGLHTGLLYFPYLANFNGVGSELVDNSSSGITTTNIAATPFTGTGLTVECGIPFLTYTHTWRGNADIQGNEADFDGASTTVLEVDVPAALNFLGSDFTIEAILTFDAHDAFGSPIVGKWGTTGDEGYLFYYDDNIGELTFGYTTDGATNIFLAASSGVPLSIGTEYHLAVTRNGADLRMFIDGVADATVHNIGTDIIKGNTPNPLTMGGYSGSTGSGFTPIYSAINMHIDSVKISNNALYTATLTPPPTLTNDANTLYLNSFEGANNSTPVVNTQ